MVTPTTSDIEQEELWYLGTLRIIQAIGQQDGHAVHPTEYAPPTGTHIYVHLKRNKDDSIYIETGELTVYCGDKGIHATAGTLVFLPQHVPYHLEVGKSAPCRYLTWMTTPGFAHKVLHIGEPDQALVLRPPLCVSEERVQQLALMLSNALTTSSEGMSRFS